MHQFILDIRPDAPARFENFLPGGNAEVLITLQMHPQPGSDPVLYLWGEPGCGKTHLLSAWATAHAATRALDEGSEGQPLVVDDVHRLDADAQIRLFSLLNAARDLHAPVVIAGPQPPMQLGLRADLATRIAQGLVLRLAALSDADKMGAIKQRADALGMGMPEEVSRYLVTHHRRDLPSLLATVDALDAYSLSRKRAVTLPLLREMLAA